MNWDDIKFVKALAAARTLEAAGTDMHVAPSTVFRRLNRIEKELGLNLFTRDRRGYHLTTAGEEMARLAEDMDLRVAETARKLARHDLSPSGMVRLTTTDTLAPLVIDHLPELQASHPEIRLELVVNSNRLSLGRREADIALRPSNNPPETLVGRNLGQIRYGVWARADLTEDAPWIGYDSDGSLIPAAGWVQDQKPEIITLTCNNLTAMTEAARQGMGRAAIPDFMAARAGGMVRQQPLPADRWTSLWLLTHADLKTLPRISAVMNWLDNRLRPDFSA